MPLNNAPLDLPMESKIIRYWCFVLLIASFAVSLVCPDVVMGAPNKVRVAILKDAKTFTLSVRGKYKIIDPTTGQELNSGRRLRKSVVTATPNGIMIADQIYLVDRLRILAQKDVSLYNKEKRLRYRGQIDIVRDKKNKFLVINSLNIEDYVKGVLYHEVPHYWPLTAIKAQAVATRTYAAYQLSMRKKEPYDVTSDIYSQVYGGRSAERYRPKIAVNRTRGQVLTFNGAILPAYFHSTCGGHTENVGALWEHDLSPLHGVKCGFCVSSPHYRWTKNFRSKDIQDKLNANGFKIGLIKKIEVLKKTNSGRVKSLKITTRDGKLATITGVRFREIIGPNTLKSNYYDIEMKGYYFDLIGRGWGHGVGMCQWGVYQMAKKRYKYTSILKHYYPDTRIVDISEIHRN